jgi:hypothetical protein
VFGEVIHDNDGFRAQFGPFFFFDGFLELSFVFGVGLIMAWPGGPVGQSGRFQ